MVSRFSTAAHGQNGTKGVFPFWCQLKLDPFPIFLLLFEGSEQVVKLCLKLKGGIGTAIFVSRAQRSWASSMKIPFHTSVWRLLSAYGLRPPLELQSHREGMAVPVTGGWRLPEGNCDCR